MLAQEKAKIGRYEIIGLLGEGAMGTVYRAFDPLIERVIALKTIRLSTSRKEHDEFVVRFYREAKSAGRLNHPNIVTIHDMGEADNLAYIAMEYLEGFSLRDMLDQRGRLPPHDALRIAVDVAEALAYAHECGVVHRDIKPANIHVMSDGSVKLTDFGIAHLIHVRETRAGMLLGSPLYMSPEQVKGQVPDGRTDIFSLGVVLYEMLTGQVPFAADNLATILYRVVNDSCPHVSTIHQTLPADLDPMLERAMAKDPGMRYPNAGAMSEAMNAWLHSHPNGIGPQLPPYAFMARRRRRQWRMAATITAPFLVLASIWALLWHKSPEPVSSAATTSQVSDDGKQAEADGGIASTQTVPPSLDSRSDTWASESKTGSNLLAEPDPNKPNLPQTGEMTRLFPLEGKLNELKKKKAELLLRYTEFHPEVVRLTRQIERLEEQKAAEGF